MESLKWIGSILASITGLCLVIGAAALLAVIGASMGAIALGVFIVLFFAAGIKGHFEDKP